MLGERVPLPVNPFCEVNINVVDPDCPGLLILTDVGLAAIVKDSPTSTSVGEEVDAA
jgi:hypothetical protein